MSVLALEAGTSGAAAGGAAAEGAGAGGASAGGGATVTPIRRGAGGAPSSPSRTLPSPRPPRPPSSPAAGRPSPATSRAGSGGGSQSRNQSPAQPGGQPRQSRSRSRGSSRSHRGNYQPVILAEFIAAVLLVAISPVATKKNPAGLSPYDGQDMIKIGAVTGTYFLLALLSSAGQEAGRWAAWFGALILLAVGLNEAANVAKALDLGGFGGSPATTGDTGGTTQSGSTIAGRN